MRLCRSSKTFLKEIPAQPDERVSQEITVNMRSRPGMLAQGECGERWQSMRERNYENWKREPGSERRRKSMAGP